MHSHDVHAQNFPIMVQLLLALPFVLALIGYIL
ncbi:cytochrome c oxidase assembly protein, partial [Clostridioides difficile]|nr:cytochrome c oxidase assembly protein [Clostridioides difficile]